MSEQVLPKFCLSLTLILWPSEVRKIFVFLKCRTRKTPADLPFVQEKQKWGIQGIIVFLLKNLKHLVLMNRCTNMPLISIQNIKKIDWINGNTEYGLTAKEHYFFIIFFGCNWCKVLHLSMKIELQHLNSFSICRLHNLWLALWITCLISHVAGRLPYP